MLIFGRHFAPHRRWAIAVLLGSMAALCWWAVAAHGALRLPGGGSTPGFTFGVLAAAIIVFEFLIWPRKFLRAWRIGSAQSWLRAHIWLGLFSVPLVVLHSGFELGGGLSTGLVVLFTLVIASGIIGLLLQQWLPRIMFERAPAETIYAEIDNVARRLHEDAARLVEATCGWKHPAAGAGESATDEPEPAAYVTLEGVRSVSHLRGKVLKTRPVFAPIAGSELLRQAFENEVGPYLLAGKRSGSRFDTGTYARHFFGNLGQQLPTAARPAVEALAEMCEQRRQFDLQARLHVWLHAWLWIHLPLSVMLVILLAVHVGIALKYW